jgi:hypothetical protein
MISVARLGARCQRGRANARPKSPRVSSQAYSYTWVPRSLFTDGTPREHRASPFGHGALPAAAWGVFWPSGCTLCACRPRRCCGDLCIVRCGPVPNPTVVASGASWSEPAQQASATKRLARRAKTLCVSFGGTARARGSRRTEPRTGRTHLFRRTGKAGSPHVCGGLFAQVGPEVERPCGAIRDAAVNQWVGPAVAATPADERKSAVRHEVRTAAKRDRISDLHFPLGISLGTMLKSSPSQARHAGLALREACGCASGCAA